MEIRELLKNGREIWGDGRMTLSQVIVCMGKVFGDLCRWERNAKKDAPFHTEEELKKEMGNVIFSAIRWCDDLGYDPEECIRLAIGCQENFRK